MDALFRLMSTTRKIWVLERTRRIFILQRN